MQHTGTHDTGIRSGDCSIKGLDADTGKRVYTRKEVADLVGASTQSIRLWEDAGSIPASIRDEGGYRYWYEEDLEAIKAYASLPRKAKLKK